MPRSGVNNLSVVKGLQELIGFEAFSSVGNEEAMLREIGVAQPSVDATEEVVHTSPKLNFSDNTVYALDNKYHA